MFRLLFILFLLPASLVAQEETLTAEEFEKYSQGHTMFFAQHGRAYGVEQYLKGRQTVWSFADGTCVKGAWFEKDGNICFTYENNPTPQCWTFHKNGGQYSARIVDADPANDLVVIGRQDGPLVCKGPDVGV